MVVNAGGLGDVMIYWLFFLVILMWYDLNSEHKTIIDEQKRKPHRGRGYKPKPWGVRSRRINRNGTN